MNERIKQVRLSTKLSQTEFAEKILVSRSAVCKMESGENSPSEQTVKLICQEFNVNEDWLRTGSGEMFVELSKDEQISAMLGEIQRLGDENFKYRLVSALCKLSESDWTALENLVDMISDKKKKRARGNAQTLGSFPILISYLCMHIWFLTNANFRIFQ